jgi:hypothetical protein
LRFHSELGDIPWESVALALVSLASTLFAVFIVRRSKDAITRSERLIVALAITVASFSLFAMLIGLMVTSGIACSHVVSLCN